MDEEEPLVGGLKEFIPQKHEIVNKEWFSKPANSCWFSLLITAVAAGFLYVCFALTGLIEIFAGNEVCPIMNLSDLTDQVPVLARQFWLKSGRQKLELFESFKRTHNKKYSSSEEEQKRLDIFLGNLDRIDELNAKRNGATYGLTKFADLTKEEFSDRNKLQFESNFQVLADDTVGYVAFSDVISDGLVDDSAKIPCEWDWRTKGAVTPVQNQGLCGDCFSFATVGSVEGTNFLATGNLVELSEQEITSCGTVDQFVSTISPTILSDEENSDDEESQRRLSSSSSSSSLELNGCEGGSLAGAFADVYQNGLVPASAYPYESFYGTAPACDEAVVESASSEAVHIGGWTWILDNDNDLDAGASISTIKRALMSLGPIAVGINAEQMQFYIGGVDHASLCLAQPPDHAVLLVGFGYSRGGAYWLIKNSWGTSWGEDGYYRIAEELGACYLQDMALVGLPAAAATR